MDEIIGNIPEENTTSENISKENTPIENIPIESATVENVPNENMPIQNVPQEPFKEPGKWKRFFKFFLILFAFIWAIWWVRAWLTKAWIIPNWLDVEILCPWSSTSINLWNIKIWDYDRTDPNCSKKCHEECKKHEDEPMWYLCWNECISKCEIPEWNNCLASCEMPDMWEKLNSYYALEDYRHWCKETYTWNNGSFECYSSSWGMGDSLSYEKHYDEWIDEMFDWYQEELKAYESCRQLCGMDPRWMMVHKPIIYLYPTEETQVNVTLWTPNNLSHTYPKYNPEKWWNVVAQPNGDLEDIDTWRKLYALYREWKTYAEDNFNEWFIVKWEDTISFLEEKLAILWLNEREAEEFIVYWLPQMENNKYNLIRFETKEEQDENMPLNITPAPDTVIRVMMDWKAIEEPIDIPEQELFTPERTWFTVVEWWGSPRN